MNPLRKWADKRVAAALTAERQRLSTAEGIKELYETSDVARVAMHNLLFSKQHVNPEMEFSFMDSNGHRYFRYTDDLNMPMVRKGVVNEFMTKLTICLTDKELGEYLTIMKACHQELLTAGKLVSKPFAIIGYYLTEMEERKNMRIHPELCFDLCATVFVREDEKETDKYDWRIHEEKVEQFKRDSASGLHDFFFISGWQEYIPYAFSSPTDLRNSVNSMKPIVEAQAKMRGSLLEQLGLLSNVSAS